MRLRRPAPHGPGDDRPEGAGALIYLPQEGRGIGLIEKIRAYNLQDKGLDTVEANTALGYRADPRDYGIGLQILKDLGLSRVRLLTNNPKKTDAFVYYGYDLKVVDQVPIVAPDAPSGGDTSTPSATRWGTSFPRIPAARRLPLSNTDILQIAPAGAPVRRC